MKGKKDLILESFTSHGTPSAWWRHLPDQALEEIHPDLLTCKKSTQDARYFKEDVWDHTMRALDYTAGQHHYPPLLQLAILQHDIGKPATRQEVANDKGEVVAVTFHNHDVVGASMTYQWMKSMDFTSSEISYVTKLVRWHLFRFEDETRDGRILRFLSNIGQDNWRDMMRLRVADRRGSVKNDPKPTFPAETKKLIRRIRTLTAPVPQVTPLAITGHDLINLGLAPGVEFRDLLAALRAAVDDGTIPNEKEPLLQMVRDRKK